MAEETDGDTSEGSLSVSVWGIAMKVWHQGMKDRFEFQMFNSSLSIGGAFDRRPNRIYMRVVDRTSKGFQRHFAFDLEFNDFSLPIDARPILSILTVYEAMQDKAANKFTFLRTCPFDSSREAAVSCFKQNQKQAQAFGDLYIWGSYARAMA